MPELFPGRSLEVSGNINSRKMITLDITRLIVLLTFNKLMKKKIFVLGMVFLLLMTACTKATEKTEEEIILSLLDQTVMITVGEYRASGVIIKETDENIIIASVAHLLSGYDQGIISFNQGKVGFADVFYCDDVSDIALLSMAKENLEEDFIALIKTAVIDMDKYEALKDADTVFLVGSATGVSENVMKGTFKQKDYYVPEFDEYLLYLYCDAFEGMSGAGCYTDEGVLIGLVTAGSENSEVVCIPVKDYIEKMEELKVK